MNILKGKVIEGNKKGRSLGFPTANIKAPKNFNVQEGIYVGYVIFKDEKYQTAFYVRKDGIIEAHLLDFDGNLYGQEIEIKIKEKIRENLEFRNDEEAIGQITKDIEKIRSIAY